MSGDSGATQLISYPDESELSQRAWARFGRLAAIPLLMLAGLSGYVLTQEAEPTPTALGCDQVRTLSRDAELTAIDTLATRNLLIEELHDQPDFLTPAYLERDSQLLREIVAQESLVLEAYSGWEEALNLNRGCFESPDLSFTRTRIRMVRVMFG